MSPHLLSCAKCIYPRWQRTNLLARIGISLLIGSGLEAVYMAIFLPMYTGRLAMLMYPWTLGCWCLALAALCYCISWCIK